MATEKSLRQIVLDSETTGFGPEFGHRVIEIGCVELLDRKLTGKHFHVYLNPQRAIDEGAFKVHGISTEFLQDKPLFHEVLSKLLLFIEGAELIIHNAPFDVGFLNSEFKHAKWPKLLHHHCSVVDTLVLAREKHPGQRNSLDALCKRYEIDNANRQLHGALLDAQILAGVYLAMTGGQGSLFVDDNPRAADTKAASQHTHVALASNSPVLMANGYEMIEHNNLVEFIIKKASVNYWQDA